MTKCPFCGSEYILFSKKKQAHICEDCGKSLEEAALQKKQQRIFLSYGHDKNSVVVEKLKQELECRGYSVWMDQKDIHHGQDWREEITKGLLESDKVISFMSRHTVRDKGVCLDELKIALCVKGTDLRTVLLEPEDEVKPPASLTSRQWLDMSEWEKHISVDGECLDDWFSEQAELLCGSIESAETEQFFGQIQQLRDQLIPELYDSRRFRLVDRMFVGRDWLRKAVDTWKTDGKAEKFFCIYGVPGSGKSTFLAHLMHYIPSFVGGVFFEWDEGRRDAMPAVIRSLAFQLASKLPDYRQQLIRILEENKDIGKYSKNELFRVLLMDPLNNCIDGKRATYLIALDALDEVLEAQPDGAAFLTEKLRNLPNWLRIVVTSRKVPAVTALLEHAKQVSLDAACAENNRDIEKYVTRRLRDVKGYHYGITYKLIQQAEGSFLYAVFYCDGVLSGSIDPNNSESMPQGLGSFYIQNFRRMFRDEAAYATIRPAMELLICCDSIPSEVLQGTTGMDFYAFRDFRRKLGSFIREETISYPYTKDTMRVLKFVHKSIPDWLRDPEKAAEFCLDPMGGKVPLARYALAQVRENRIYIHKPQRYYDQCPQIAVDLELDYLQERLGRFLIDAGLLKEYEQFLLEQDTPWIPYWREAEKFPVDYPMDALLDRLRDGFQNIWERISTGFMSASAEYVIMFDVMADVIHTSKSALVLFEQLKSVGLDRFYRSGASDAYQHRGAPAIFNADKVDTAHHISRCIRKCQKLNIPVPEDCVQAAERIKLSCLYYWGEYDDMVDTAYMNFPYFFRDNICILDDEATASQFNFREVADIRREFNTYCLQEYLKGFGQDDTHADRLIRENADLDAAVNRLMPQLERDCQSRGLLEVNTTMGAAMKRLNYISYLQNRYAPRKKWHPRPAEYVRCLGAMNDYCDLYRFPCCGTDVITDDGAPSQYRSDGCEDLPR